MDGWGVMAGCGDNSVKGTHTCGAIYMYAAFTATASQHNVLNIEARNVCRRMVKLGQTAHTNTLLMTTALTRNNVLFFCLW